MWNKKAWKVMAPVRPLDDDETGRCALDACQLTSGIQASLVFNCDDVLVTVLGDEV